MEVAWRWLFGLLCFGVACLLTGGSVPQRWPEYRDDLTIALHGGFLFSVQWGRFIATVLLLTVAWSLVFALGRTAVLRRFDSSVRTRYPTIAILTLLRVLAFEAMVAVWCWVAIKTSGPMMAAPFDAANGMDMLPAFAMLLGATLLLFVLWSLLSWIFYLAPLLALSRSMTFMQSLNAAWHSGPLRGKLVEINLVMNIVRIALIVLAMVFSASPLPFSNVETQTFLNCWWIGVGVFWLVASDYFHVVRAAAYLSLYRAYAIGGASGPDR
jgi:hypothetical protein